MIVTGNQVIMFKGKAMVKEGKVELEGKIALITGAGGGGPGGMGKGIAMCFAREGASIVVNDIDRELGEKTAEEIRALGCRAIVSIADVSKEKEVNSMVAKVIDEWGGVDILVNNVGLGLSILVEDMLAEDWHSVVSRNLDAPFYCAKAVIPTMKSRGGGKIISISSMAGKRISAMAGAAYTSSKAGVLGLTRQLAFELGPYNINVNAICPAGVISSYNPPQPEELESIAKRIPIRKIISSEEIGELALFLASERSKTITGASIDIDGGTSVAMGDWEDYVRVRKEWVANNRK